ncbi:spermatid-specific linker histone H1-like protein-like [Platysternon megacephalum]|uniref:Spermatid-specific linker histone H1-like protein-like n=1 Tax=Platysternon megacephalum TaxID=55544 RepID=A0A4D9EKJ3_9SAUR|nr:spermatid-specific linker histone H1-like protein-like [Platysternon megacephalum]
MIVHLLPFRLCLVHCCRTVHLPFVIQRTCSRHRQVGYLCTHHLSAHSDSLPSVLLNHRLNPSSTSGSETEQHISVVNIFQWIDKLGKPWRAAEQGDWRASVQQPENPASFLHNPFLGAGKTFQVIWTLSTIYEPWKGSSGMMGHLGHMMYCTFIFKYFILWLFIRDFVKGSIARPF